MDLKEKMGSVFSKGAGFQHKLFGVFKSGYCQTTYWDTEHLVGQIKNVKVVPNIRGPSVIRWDSSSTL